MGKYFLSVDIEGITGVVNKTFCSEQYGENYRLGRTYMTEDVNAVIEGILATDSDAYILVKDAHESATNIYFEKLHPRAHLMQGWGNVMNMAHPLDETFTGLFLIGYHAGGQNSNAVLAHTMSSSIHEIKVNGQMINETGVSAIAASSYNVPVAFISGDDQAILEANNQLKETNFVGVEVKKSMGRDSAISMPLNKARGALTVGAKKATENLLAKKVKLLTLEKPIKAELKLYNVGFRVSVFAKLASLLEFDKNYSLDHENFTISFEEKSEKEFSNRLELLITLLFGVKSLF